MPGPAPKPKDQRVNRHKPRSGEWVVLPAANEGPIPALPVVAGIRWKKRDREWWNTIWQSPMATQWQEADVYGLVELALLRYDFLEGDTSVISEITKKSDKFGLTPKGRRDLRWVITEEDAESAGVAPLAPVRRLRAVDPK